MTTLRMVIRNLIPFLPAMSEHLQIESEALSTFVDSVDALPEDYKTWFAQQLANEFQLAIKMPLPIVPNAPGISGVIGRAAIERHYA